MAIACETLHLRRCGAYLRQRKRTPNPSNRAQKSAKVHNCSDRFYPTNANDIVSGTGLAYQIGPLGGFYQASGSALINKGNICATNAGLYHFTVVTNLGSNNLEICETNSVVDIGYHYVGTDASGNPIDTDGDGFPDYLEDTNGDGVFDTGDLSNWLIYDSPNGLVTGSGLQVFTPLH